jgi:ComF family protein
MPPSALGRTARRLGGFALDALFPPHCLTCDAAVSAQGTLCAPCFAQLRFCAGPLCPVCGAPAEQDVFPCADCAERPPLFRAARAALLYDGLAKRLVLGFKHADRTELAAPLARHMARAGAALLGGCDLIAPVPLHRWRLLRRRHNQAALLAAELSALSGKPWEAGLLRRLRATAPLGEKGAAERAEAVAGAFDARSGAEARIAGRSVLLVDDVLTSGATANACAAALLVRGAREVCVLAAARVPKKRDRGQ